MSVITPTTTRPAGYERQGAGFEGKKRYQKPKLVDYGGIRALTANMGPKGAFDGLGISRTALSQ